MIWLLIVFAGALMGCEGRIADTEVGADQSARRRHGYCGDGRCSASESCSSCASDCGTCPTTSADMASAQPSADMASAQSPADMAWSPPSSGTVYYVATTGSDANAGTLDRP